MQRIWRLSNWKFPAVFGRKVEIMIVIWLKSVHITSLEYVRRIVLMCTTFKLVEGNTGIEENIQPKVKKGKK